MYFNGKSIPTSDGESKNLASFWNPRKVKKTAPEMAKTIVAIKRYIDFLYILGDLCSPARNCHVTVKHICHFSLKIPKHVNNCYPGRFLGPIAL